jgi:predicted helicase
MTDIIPDLELIGKSQCFPRYHYEPTKKPGNALFATGGGDDVIDGYARHDAITDYIHKEATTKYGPGVTKDDLFYYVYGFLHSEDYKTAFSADLKKSLPRIPLVDGAETFWAFSKAGRELAELHLNYETAEPYAGAVVTGQEKGDFRVDKIRFAKSAGEDDKTTIIYNSSIKISGVPLEAYDYAVNGRSAVDWNLDRYQIKVDKDSGIKNDPNDWAKERDQPRYILDLILRIITVSLETMKIVRGLPRLKF